MITEITERITKGMSVQATDADSFEEPVSLSEIKLFISMDSSLTVHDNTLNALNAACRGLIEKKTGVSLIQRSVVVSWREFYDFEKLPYWPVKSGTDVTITDLEDVGIDSDEYSLTGVGGFLTLTGDFPEGVKVSYTALSDPVAEEYKQMIKSMVYEVFVNKTPIQKALSMHVTTLPL